MVCLEEIAAIANILKTAPASTVQLLHKIVNDELYSKSSRKELKKFAGFPQNYDIEARKDKILKDFTKTELITVCIILGLNCAGRAKELSEHIFKNLSDLASLKNNFTEQLTDDEDEDSAPFSLESTNDANKQPLTPPIYHFPSPQDVLVPLPQTQRNQSQRGNEENVFLLKDLFSTMRSFTGNDNYSVKAFFRDVEENFIFIPHISDLQKIICVKRLLQEKEFLGAPLTPPKRVTRFPRLEEGNVPINTSWFGLFWGISRVLGESSTARGYPSADSSPIRKADCVSKKNPLQNTEVNRREI
ncbi:uncharacterized protein LOC105457711 [Trichonephila clavipes]|nr:uncharacterized protein LOC105457711 [Trichonephila clavipes]